MCEWLRDNAPPVSEGGADDEEPELAQVGGHSTGDRGRAFPMRQMVATSPKGVAEVLMRSRSGGGPKPPRLCAWCTA